MSALDQLFKKLQSTLDVIFSHGVDSANSERAESSNLDVERAATDEVDGQHPSDTSDSIFIQNINSPKIDSKESLGTNSSKNFKPQVLDNGRTLLLGIMGEDNNTQDNEKRHHTPPSLIGAQTAGRKQLNLSPDEFAALLDIPVEEEKDASIMYKLKCSKCEVNGKIDSFTETFVCPMCGGTMYLIEVYANHSQHTPEEIKQQLCVLYSKYQRGDLQAQRTWTLLTSQSHSDSKLEEYMRQYLKPYSIAAEKTSNSSSTIVSRSNTETQKISRTVIGSSTKNEAYNKSSNSTCSSRIQLSPAAFRSGEQKTAQFTPVARPVNRTVVKPYLLIPELERTYKIVNESGDIKYLFSNNDQSLLRALGYRVGKSSKLTATDRRKILVKIFVADTSTINAKWNKPMTQERITALISFLRRLNDSDLYKMNDYSVAIKHRREDIAWLSNYTAFVKEAIQIAKTTTIF